MKYEVAILLCAMAVSAPAQSTPPSLEPSAAALALARAANDRPASSAELHSIAGPIAQNLLYGMSATRGLSCEPGLPACREAAERLAIETAPAIVAARREQRAWIVAMAIDDTMTPAEIGRAAAFVGTPAGKGLTKSLMLGGDPSAMSRELQSRIAEVMMRRVPDPAGVLFDRFYAATKTLPRRAMPVAPPPPPMITPRQP